MKKLFVKVSFLLLFLIYAYPLYTYLNIVRSLNNLDFFLKDTNKIENLSGHPYIDFILFLNLQQDNKKVLTIRQAEAVNYAQKEIIHVYDKRMSKIVKARSKKHVIKLLKELNIGYIATYYYDDPVYYATFIKDILNDPTVSTLIYNQNGIYLYKIEANQNFLTVASSPSNKNFALKVTPINIEMNGTYWLSHTDADLYPYLPPNRCIKELKEDDSRIYIYNLNLEIEVLQDVVLTLKKIHYNKFELKNPLSCSSDLIRDFYLKKGDYKLSTRFFNDRGPFRLLFSTQKKNAFIIKHATMKPETLPLSSFNLKTKDGEIPLFRNEKYVQTKNDIMFENGPKEFSNLNYLIPPKSKIKLDIEGEGLFCIYKNKNIVIGKLTLPFKTKYLDCFGLAPERKMLTVDFEERAYLRFVLQQANDNVRKCWVKIYSAELN